MVRDLRSLDEKPMPLEPISLDPVVCSNVPSYSPNFPVSTPVKLLKWFNIAGEDPTASTHPKWAVKVDRKSLLRGAGDVQRKTNLAYHGGFAPKLSNPWPFSMGKSYAIAISFQPISQSMFEYK